MVKLRTALSIVLLVALLAFVVYLIFYQGRTSESASFDLVTTTIPVTYQFKNGIHTYVGTIETPTPCYKISGGATVKESYPEQVDIRIEAKESGGICAQVIASKKFKVSFEASREASVDGFVNSTPVLFKVTEASPSVDLEKTEI